MGPLLDLWNFVRRPLPQITMTVVEPFEARLSAETQTLSLSQGGSATFGLTAENCPEGKNIVAKGLPLPVCARCCFPATNCYTSSRAHSWESV